MNIWETEALDNINAKWLVDLREDHRNLPEQEPVTGQDDSDSEASSQGYRTFKLPGDYLPCHNMKAPLKHHNSLTLATG